MTKEVLYKKSEKYLKKILEENLPKGSKYFLFGSRATDLFSKSSDIDVGIISKRLNKNVVIKIKEIIEESFIPWNVDIIDFNKVSDNFKNESLKRIILWN